MSQATHPLTEPAPGLVIDDGEPLESTWHRVEMNLFIDVIHQAMAERGGTDYFVGGNAFIYYSRTQARAVATQPIDKTRHFRGPDVFFVAGVDPRPDRDAWVVWDEEGRYPQVILELLSPTTARIDRTTKKAVYEQTFRTPEYFLYERDTDLFEGFRLVDGVYRPIAPDADGRLECRELGLRVGRWQGCRDGLEAVWLRLYHGDGRLIPTAVEAERQRAEAAEAEVARLRALLGGRTGT